MLSRDFREARDLPATVPTEYPIVSDGPKPDVGMPR